MKKMNLRLKAYDLLTATLVCLITTLIVSTAVAAEEDAPPVEDYRTASDLVELHYPVNVQAPYKQRRETNGFMFDAGYENVMLDRYVSIADFKTFYQEMFGETEFPLVNVDFSYKYNFILGSLLATVGYGYGSISDDASGVKRTLTLTKVRGSVSYLADNMFNEPYVVPYGTIGYQNLGIEEKADDVGYSHAVDTIYYQMGLLFQLDWLDPSYSKRTISEYSLQNTYLDVFMSKYEPSSNSEDPDTSTDFMFGAGIRLEF
ncbi:MAG: hypothetical protein JSU04_02050 [Bdellovibrionales bacterium]|nr:hypothetical protein [Bdellovibrionales bacterium]